MTGAHGCNRIIYGSSGPGLTGSQNRRVVDIEGAASAGEIVRRFREPLQHRTDGSGSAQTLRQFVADVAGPKVGKDKRVGVSGDSETGSLGSADGRYQGRI